MASSSSVTAAGTRSRTEGIRRAFGKLSGTLRPGKDKSKGLILDRQNYALLRGQLEALLCDINTRFAGANVSPLMMASIENLCKAIKRELDDISNQESQKLKLSKDPSEVIECYHLMYKNLELLALNAGIGALEIADEQATENRLKSLTPSVSAYYNSAAAALLLRRECTPETRKHVLAEINAWRHHRNVGKLYWLNGMAGTGKTTIASTLCAQLDKSRDLAASFFCTRQLPECRNVKFIIPTIAYQLARFSPDFRHALSRVLENDPDVHTRTLPNQFEGMIAAPLRRIADALPAEFLVVIDALDECDQSSGVAEMLEMLLNQASELPMKVFVSSRPEPRIRQKLAPIHSKLILHELELSIIKEDIRTYLQTELEQMSLTEAQLTGLVERAGALFIYAATAVRYIAAEDFSLNPESRLEVVLESKPASSIRYNEIDALYGTVLDSAFNNPNLEPSDKQRMKVVLHTVVCTQEPLTVDALTGLLQLRKSAYVYAALRPLWSVLHVFGAEDLVTTLHTSFIDYILDANRSRAHNCEARAQHDRLAVLCFARIKINRHQFNICKLGSSYVCDSQVIDIEVRIREAILPDLLYACQYWAIHLELGGNQTEYTALMAEFLSTKLLLWMEVLNLKKLMKVGPMLLSKSQKWCATMACSQELQDLVRDALLFTTMFAKNSVCRSTPHIYVSMLASWPISRPVSLCYVPRTNGLVRFEGNGAARRELALVSQIAVDAEVQSIAFSPSGMYIASGSMDNAVRVWDVQSGCITLGPLHGHTEPVNTVAFSPDSTIIASGSEDTTICTWGVQSGQVILGPFGEHTGPVYQVTFSPDGMRIASCSKDKTICFWDTQSGQMVLGPLQGHRGTVTSVAFSPDGARLASSSRDMTIGVWDAHSGQMVLAPLEGHSQPVGSVVYSPDGTRIVSGAGDTTICVWDAQNGSMLLGPLTGHTDSVISVAFSPDGGRIASASVDETIAVRDSQRGGIILGPLTGHARPVRSVVFSPDGMYMASGSHDKTICIWDAQNRLDQVAPVMDPIPGHTRPIFCATFSPNGKYIASGSRDYAIYVWDAKNGERTLGPLKGHDAGVLSVAFSHDGTRIASGSIDGTICVWDAQNGQKMLGPLVGHDESVSSVVFYLDDTRIASGCDGGAIRLWCTQTGQRLGGSLVEPAGPICQVAFSPDGIYLASPCYDCTMGIWNAQNVQMMQRLEGHLDLVWSAAFSPDSMRVASGSRDGTICVWDVHSGQIALGPLQGHAALVQSVSFSPNGMYIASGSNDMTLCVWDALDGQMILGPLRGHTNYIRSVAFSPNGAWVVSSSEDRTIRMWCVQEDYLETGVSPPSTPGRTPSIFPGASEPSTSALTSWELDKHGWVTDDESHLLCWVPPDMRGRLLRPRNSFLISTQGSIRLNFENAKIGEWWTEYYVPA